MTSTEQLEFLAKLLLPIKNVKGRRYLQLTKDKAIAEQNKLVTLICLCHNEPLAEIDITNDDIDIFNFIDSHLCW